MRILLSLLLVMSTSLFADCEEFGQGRRICMCQRTRVSVTESLVAKEGAPAPLLKKLLTTTGFEGPFDWEAILNYTQRHWIVSLHGQNGMERCDSVDSPQLKKKRTQIVTLMQQMGFFKAQLPLSKHYRYGVCLGSFLPGVRARLHQLAEAWRVGVRFDVLVFLTGERALRKGSGDKDDLAALCNPALSPLPFRSDWKLSPEVPYEMETDMVRLVLSQVELPPAMQALPVHIINTPRGEAARPSTGDTYRYWLETEHPEPGSVLASSSPLLWHYQYLVGLNVLGTAYPLDTMGVSSTPDKWPVSVLLDTVAKCLYELKHGG